MTGDLVWLEEVKPTVLAAQFSMVGIEGHSYCPVIFFSSLQPMLPNIDGRFVTTVASLFK